MHGQDSFAGTWKMDTGRSNFDPNHRPSEGTMRFEPTPEGYVMYAEGTSGGKHIKEHPMHFILDGSEQLIVGASDMAAKSTRTGPNTIGVEVCRAGQVIGGGTYVVSDDGTTLTTTVHGIDIENRHYQTTVVWVRQEPARSEASGS